MPKTAPRFRKGDAVIVSQKTKIPLIGGKIGGITNVQPLAKGGGKYTVRIQGVQYFVPEADLQPILARRETTQ